MPAALGGETFLASAGEFLGRFGGVSSVGAGVERNGGDGELEVLGSATQSFASSSASLGRFESCGLRFSFCGIRFSLSIELL
jgi:hypothetical protein